MDPKAAAAETGPESPDVLAAGYRRMAADRERESEAAEWTEALVGDICDSE